MSDTASPPSKSPPAIAKFCLRCRQHLPDGGETCPNCGLPYNPYAPATYRTANLFRGWKFWFPGFCLAVASGVISYAVVVQIGQMGWALFVSVPASFGAILGYATRARIWWAVSLALVVVASVVMALVWVNLAGFFCGVTLGAFFLGPAMVGVTLGWLLREFLKNSRWSQRQFLPLVFFALIPYAAELVEYQLPRRTEVATVVTDLTFHATPEQAWRSIQFYEQVEHAPPLLLRLLLPRPVRRDGNARAVGEVVRCIYDRGQLVKKITRRVEQRELAFDVIEQKLHFEQDVTLLDGRFEVEPLDADRTRVRLTTRYRRHLRPTWEWRPVEEAVIHALHGHVLEGMRRKAEQPVGPKRYPPPAESRPVIPVAQGGPVSQGDSVAQGGPR